VNGALGDSTISIKGAINVKGQEPIEVDRRFSAGNSPILAAGSVAGPISSLLGSGFDDVQIERRDARHFSTDTKYAGTLERIALSKTEARRGETIEVQAYVRTEIRQAVCAAHSGADSRRRHFRPMAQI